MERNVIHQNSHPVVYQKVATVHHCQFKYGRELGLRTSTPSLRSRPSVKKVWQ
jgi:hypothetical protein